MYISRNTEAKCDNSSMRDKICDDAKVEISNLYSLVYATPPHPTPQKKL